MFAYSKYGKQISENMEKIVAPIARPSDKRLTGNMPQHTYLQNSS